MNKFYKNRNPKKSWQLLISCISVIFGKRKRIISSLDSISSLVIVYPHLLGDIVMLIPFLKFTKRVIPRCKITLICMKYGKDILESQHLVDNFILFKKPIFGGRTIVKNKNSLVAAILDSRKESYDMVIDPFGNYFATIFASMLKAKYYVGVDYSNLRNLQNITIPYLDKAHLVDGMLCFFEYFGYKINNEDRYPVYKIPNFDSRKATDFFRKNDLENKTVIGIHPGASVPSRRWSGYSSLINMLLTREDCRIILFCGPGDEAEFEKVIKGINIELRHKVIICQKLIKEYLAILSKCKHVVCNDSSCGHFSAALGVGVTILFAQGQVDFIKPRSNSVINIVSKDFPCKPCLKNVCPKGTNECFTWITPQYVFDLVNKCI